MIGFTVIRQFIYFGFVVRGTKGVKMTIAFIFTDFMHDFFLVGLRLSEAMQKLEMVVQF